MIEQHNGVVAAGDWHGNKRYALAAIEHTDKIGCKTIVHTGDFGYHFGTAFLDDLNKELVKRDMYLYFVDGNHENFHVLYTYEIAEDGTRPLRDRIIHLPRGFRWVWDDEIWLALGGAVSVDKEWRVPGQEWWSEEQLSFGDVLTASRAEADIMITHDCPSGIEIAIIQGNPHGFPANVIREADAHRDTMQLVVNEVKPKLLIHGHYHYKYNDVLIGEDYVTKVHGLDCDGGPLSRNIMIVRKSVNDSTEIEEGDEESSV
ncbi:metallophosphoesterase [Rhodococcus phage NiceHouse]|nr:metallophosphoesterase [Rhodococcus phage NiceHouse]